MLAVCKYLSVFMLVLFSHGVGSKVGASHIHDVVGIVLPDGEYPATEGLTIGLYDDSVLMFSPDGIIDEYKVDSAYVMTHDGVDVLVWEATQVSTTSDIKHDGCMFVFLAYKDSGMRKYIYVVHNGELSYLLRIKMKEEKNG